MASPISNSAPRVPNIPSVQPQQSVMAAPSTPSSPAASGNSAQIQDSFEPPKPQAPVDLLGLRSGSGGILGVGSTGAEVTDLQSRLNAQGFDSGPADGIFGPRTDSAVRSYQAANGLEVDGLVGPQTWSKLNGATAPAPAEAAAATPSAPSAAVPGVPTLSRGATGASVTDLQNRLTAAGFDTGPADGDFGPKTEAAVKAYQTSRGLEVDGVVGPQTWGSLRDGAAPVQGPQPTPPAADGDLRQRILSIAQGEVGTREVGENSGPVLKYPNAFGRGSEAWCGDFVSWVNTQAGNPMNEPYVPSLVTHMQDAGKWKGTQDPKPGDLVVFDWYGDGPEHVGIVKGVNADGSLQTIEGNTSSPRDGTEGVWEKTRYMDSVYGFANP